MLVLRFKRRWCDGSTGSVLTPCLTITRRHPDGCFSTALLPPDLRAMDLSPPAAHTHPRNALRLWGGRWENRTVPWAWDPHGMQLPFMRRPRHSQEIVNFHNTRQAAECLASNLYDSLRAFQALGSCAACDLRWSDRCASRRRKTAQRQLMSPARFWTCTGFNLQSVGQP